MKKKPRFFCDNCGSEVEHGAKTCPQCGRFFASVRCPSCGLTGEEGLFTSGCPGCGYSAPSTRNAVQLPEKKSPAGQLPLWVYILSIAALLIVFALLFFAVMR